MLIFKGSPGLHKIVVLNPKGGSGKTTLAFNLAGYLAATGRKVAIIDMDPQGSSMRWLRNRSPDLPTIVGIPADVSFKDESGDRCIVVPREIDCIVVDAPAGVPGDRLIDFTCGAHAIFVPVLPSDLDIHAASRLISDLLLKAQVSRRNQRLCVVPNRVRERTVAYQQLCRFLDRLAITVVGLVRDSQNYVWAAKNGTCIHEMPSSRVGKDRELWQAISQWLERRLATPLTPRDSLRPERTPRAPRRQAKPATRWYALAAGLGAIAVALGGIVATNGSDVAPDRFEALTPATEMAHQAIVTEIPEFVTDDVTNPLGDRWRLNGTVSWGDSGLLMIRDLATDAALVVRRERDLHGWEISEIGSDYAVFSRNGDEVRLDLEYDTPF